MKRKITGDNKGIGFHSITKNSVSDHTAGYIGLDDRVGRIWKGIAMMIGTASIKIYLPWVHSLKEKRMVVKSICAKVHNQFNVSIAEVGEQDIHQIAVLGLAGIAGNRIQADSIIDHVLSFIESNTEGEVVDIEREII